MSEVNNEVDEVEEQETEENEEQLEDTGDVTAGSNTSTSSGDSTDTTDNNSGNGNNTADSDTGDVTADSTADTSGNAGTSVDTDTGAVVDEEEETEQVEGETESVPIVVTKVIDPDVVNNYAKREIAIQAVALGMNNAFLISEFCGIKNFTMYKKDDSVSVVFKKNDVESMAMNKGDYMVRHSDGTFEVLDAESFDNLYIIMED